MTQRMDNDEAILTLVMFCTTQDEWGDWDCVDGPLPEGWTYLGSGVSRAAFLGPDGWVYKFGSTWANDGEVNAAQRLFTEQDSTFGVPWVEHVGDYGHYSVIRAEYIAGEWHTEYDYYANKDEWRDLSRFIIDHARVGDVHYGNVCFRDGTPVIIDLGA